MALECIRPLALLCVLVAAQAQPPAACTVTLTATGVKSNAGVIGFALFASEQGWPEGIANAYKDNAIPAKPGSVELKFTGIKPGRYAVVALHDENSNKKLDKKASGRPKEGWAMSNNPKAGLKVPKFAAAATSIQCGDRLELMMRYPAKDETKATN